MELSHWAGPDILRIPTHNTHTSERYLQSAEELNSGLTNRNATSCREDCKPRTASDKSSVHQTMLPVPDHTF